MKMAHALISVNVASKLNNSLIGTSLFLHCNSVRQFDSHFGKYTEERLIIPTDYIKKKKKTLRSF